MSDATWAALTAMLTLLGILWTVYAFRNRGVASALRGAGFTLLPAAAYMTGTLEMVTEIGQSIADWATPWSSARSSGPASAWAACRCCCSWSPPGCATRSRRQAPADGTAAPTEKRRRNRSSQADQPQPAVMDDDMADIEAILRKRGIS